MGRDIDILLKERSQTYRKNKYSKKGREKKYVSIIPFRDIDLDDDIVDVDDFDLKGRSQANRKRRFSNEGDFILDKPFVGLYDIRKGFDWVDLN